MTGTTNALLLGNTLAVAQQEWREHSRCAGAFRHGDEFVDVAPTDAQRLVDTYCRPCPVIALCRAEGDRTAPHKWATVMGGRHYAKGEPVDGWEVAS